MLIANPEYTTRTGMEPWFQMPGHWTAPPPPKYKMALLVGLAIYPLLLIVIPVMGILFGEYPFLANPFTLTPEFFTRTLVNSAILVPVMTWFAMPRLTKLCRGWLYPDEKGPTGAEGGADDRDRR